MKYICFKSDSELVNKCKKAILSNMFMQEIYFGKIVTGESFMTIEGRKEIIEKYDLLCVDM